jgi:hypothetical protein
MRQTKDRGRRSAAVVVLAAALAFAGGVLADPVVADVADNPVAAANPVAAGDPVDPVTPVVADPQARGPEALGFTKHFAVEITNPSKLSLENHVIIIDVADIRASVAADFNTYMYAFFDAAGGEYALVVSQADDLDKDRYHDQIVLVRTLAPSSTTRLLCYYTPERSFQLMPAQKAFARLGWEPGGAEAGWESNLVAFKFVHGRIGFYGKLQPGLVLKKFPAAEAKPQDWGVDALGARDSAGLGGLSLWDGATRIPLYGPAAPPAKLTVISPGPVRGLVKAEYPAIRTAAGEVALTVYLSAFSDNEFSRQDVVVAAKPGAPVVLGPGLDKLPGETSSLDKAKGTLTVWGRGAGKAGQIGLAAIFAPADLAGADEAGSDHAVKLKASPVRDVRDNRVDPVDRVGHTLTYWVAGAWERGASAPGVPDAKGWAAKVDGLAARLLVPVKVEFKAP